MLAQSSIEILRPLSPFAGLPPSRPSNPHPFNPSSRPDSRQQPLHFSHRFSEAAMNVLDVGCFRFITFYPEVDPAVDPAVCPADMA